MNYEERVIPAQRLLLVRTRATVPRILELSQRWLTPLMHAARDSGLEVEGPFHYFYIGFSGDVNEEFTLELAVPVSGEGTAPAGFELRDDPEQRVFATDYRGAMSGIGEGWHGLVEAFQASGLRRTGTSREVYRTWVGYDSPENVTELQIELA